MWRGQILESSDNVVTMGITPAPDCIVGKYRMHVAVVTPYGIRRTRRDPQLDTYIIFNPWSPGQELLLCSSVVSLKLKFIVNSSEFLATRQVTGL